MTQPRCIRVFYSQRAAESARKAIISGGFDAYVKEDTFAGFPLSKFNMFRRFKLYVNEKDINRIGEFLAKKIQKK